MQRHPLFCVLYWNNKYLHIAIYKNNRETLCLIIFVNKQKTSCCNNCKIFIITMFWGVFKSSEPLFWLGGYYPLQGEENRPQRKSESQDEYLGRFRHTGGRLPLCNFGADVGDSYFPGADGCCSAHGLPSPPPLSFSFKSKMLKFEGSLGKFVWGLEFTYLCKEINVYGKFMGVVNSRLRECGPNLLGS